MIVIKEDCINYGARWLANKHNFDNIFNASLTLFEMMTTEGWMQVMYSGIDAKGINRQPELNYQPYWSFYFIGFIIVGNVFMINLFVGVVIENFNRMKDKLCGYVMMTDEQRQWVEIQKYMISKTLSQKQQVPVNWIRKQIFRMIGTKYFEWGITLCILINTLVMCLRYYRMSPEQEYWLEILNYGFAIIFNLEMVLKLIGLGKYYYSSGWNRFD